jgi:hypothetical protein
MTEDRNPRHNATFLVYAETKRGKSTLGASCPGPVLALDAEGSWNAFEGRKNPNNPNQPYRVIWWDPKEAPPKADGTWDICVVDVLRWETVEQVIQWTLMPDHPFQSIVVDSVTQLQKRCKEALPGFQSGNQQYSDWGQLLTRMSEKVQRFRDMVKDVRNPFRVAVFTAEGDLRQDGKYVPNMEGALRKGIAYWMNTTACLTVKQVPNADGIIAADSPLVRSLMVKPNPNYITGSHFEDRFETNTVENPNITLMMGQIFPGFVPE